MDDYDVGEKRKKAEERGNTDYLLALADEERKDGSYSGSSLALGAAKRAGADEEAVKKRYEKLGKAREEQAEEMGYDEPGVKKVGYKEARDSYEEAEDQEKVEEMNKKIEKLKKRQAVDEAKETAGTK